MTMFLIGLPGLLTRLEPLRTVACNIFKVFPGFNMLIFCIKSSLMEKSLFLAVSSFLVNRQLWMVLDGKSFWEYPVVLLSLKDPFLALFCSSLYINDLLNYIICNISFAWTFFHAYFQITEEQEKGYFFSTSQPLPPTSHTVRY